MTGGHLAGDEGFAARMFLRSGGRSAEDVRRRPVIGICTSWSELNPCNSSLAELANAVKQGVHDSGGLGLVFGTISLSEALVRPTTMLLRNLMSMDVEEMINASPIDGVVLLYGCDKTVAAQLMGATSANKPAVGLGAGPRKVGSWQGAPVTIDDSWRFIDQRRTGQLDDTQWQDLEGSICPSSGVCNVLGTATTLAMIAEVLGFALPGSSLVESGSAGHAELAHRTGVAAVRAAHECTLPTQNVTRRGLLDAWRLVCAIGGSTNAAVHLLALAGRAGVPLTLDDLEGVGARTPTLVNVKPNGPLDLADLHAEGGVAAVMRELSGQVDLDRQTADGRTWREVVSALPPAAHRAVLPASRPLSPVGALAVLHGSLAPRGAVIKRSAATPELLRHVGRAVVFDGVADLRARIDDPELDVDATSVLVLRGCGPIGGGMPEAGAIPIPAKLYAQGIRDMVRITDARMSGTAAGTVILHVAPESAVGGPLALVRDGDEIEIDVAEGRLDLLVDHAALAGRSHQGNADPPPRGYGWLHHQHVMQADTGCDFDFLRDATTREIPEGAA
ncbi:MAG: dihydroxy-acid dehydratase [Frankiales bacterium]|nr:dihydroxy-acid dehydratase [Frankiales bacterium]